MANTSIVGFSGNITRPSKTFGFVDHVVSQIGRRNRLSVASWDIEDLGASFATARRASDLGDQAGTILRAVAEADLLVVGSPTYKGSYTGLFKHFFDLLDPTALRGKPVLLTATGGGDRHALIVEHQLRPLFGFFEAYSLPTAIYATERDFADGQPASEAFARRIDQALDEAGAALRSRIGFAVAAE